MSPPKPKRSRQTGMRDWGPHRNNRQYHKKCRTRTRRIAPRRGKDVRGEGRPLQKGGRGRVPTFGRFLNFVFFYPICFYLQTAPSSIRDTSPTGPGGGTYARHRGVGVPHLHLGTPVLKRVHGASKAFNPRSACPSPQGPKSRTHSGWAH